MSAAGTRTELGPVSPAIATLLTAVVGLVAQLLREHYRRRALERELAERERDDLSPG